ncbi:MAG: DUF5615 family PIN-like protein [Cytophagaceae bacterium]|nr:DUF5615 family PIN-like protein [Cytophagaceae bacterium]
MRLLVDERTGPSVARWLMEQGHDVYSVPDESPGWEDVQIIAHARAKQRIIVSMTRILASLFSGIGCHTLVSF